MPLDNSLYINKRQESNQDTAMNQQDDKANVKRINQEQPTIN